METCDVQGFLPAVFPWEQPCGRSSESRHRLQKPQPTTESSSHGSTRSDRCTAACRHPETNSRVTSDTNTALFALSRVQAFSWLTLVFSSPYFRHRTHCLLSLMPGGGGSSGLSSRSEGKNVWERATEKMCKASVHASIWAYTCRSPYQKGVGVVEVEIKEEGEGRLENLVRQGSWAEELGWSFSWGGGAQRGKAPVSPATARSCGPGTEAAQHSGEAHCWE